MVKSDWIRELTETDEGRLELERQRTWIEATEAICSLMESGGVSRAELSRRLGTTPSHVTQLLSGQRNFTLRTLSDVFHALGHAVRIEHSPLGDSGRLEWSHSGWKTDRGRSAPRTPRRDLKLYELAA